MHLEQIIKQRLKDYEYPVDPPQEIWDNIQKQLSSPTVTPTSWKSHEPNAPQAL
jgi:hypothetical protein